MASKNKKLNAALWYHKQGLSVIPTDHEKKPPLIDQANDKRLGWTRYQKKRASANQIKKWWEQWPDANPAIVCGEISDITVLDADSKDGIGVVEDFLPDSALLPVANTPGGGRHYYFKYRQGLSNRVRALKDCDVRTEGGYVVAPPGQNGKGAYSWVKGVGIHEVSPAPMPDMLFDTLQQFSPATEQLASPPSQAGEHLYKKDSIHSSVFSRSRGASQNLGCDGPVTNCDACDVSFDQGRRDDSLFTIANALIKGGLSPANAELALVRIASTCNPPFPEKEAREKVRSALKRSKSRESGISDAIREIISVTSGDVSVTQLYQDVTSVTRKEKDAVRQVVRRLVREGLLEPTGKKAGVYRIISSECEAEDWMAASTECVDMWLPFDLDRMIEIPPGSIILVMGAQDAGKSALLLNTVRYNMHKWNTHYFSSELNSSSFKKRVGMFDGLTPDMWNVKFYTRTTDWDLAIKPGKGNLNVIDYLEIHDQFYLVAKLLADIHRRLDGAVAVIALQKDPKQLYGRGGSFTQEKPILSLALDKGVATITKFKGEWQGDNPNGKQYRFKLLHAHQFIQDRSGPKGWHTPVGDK
jgi:hypothetical protein